jgi:hypothetical protein
VLLNCLLFCLKAAFLQADDYLNTLPIKVHPGIGFTVSAKLKSNQVEYCGQLRKISKVCQPLACVV